ncbi:MAG TPA: methyltransferase domain-containing protein [Burkholderiaceae bacterium]|nr:methyltransferase domain-containing protein [Burkholderiaceae bacterium]
MPTPEPDASTPSAGEAQPEFLAKAFAGWRSQRGMLADVHRTGSFARAIAAAVTPGMTVADVGCGSGILSLFAARAGAARVHALEATRMIDDAAEVARANGFDDHIAFVAGDARHFNAPGGLDAVIGEWIGMYLFEEWRHFDAFAAVRDRCLRQGGIVMPRRVRLYLAPIDDSRLYMERGPGFWERPVWGFDFGLVHRRQLDRTRRIIVKADHRTVLDAYCILDLDCASDDSRAYFFAHDFETRLSHAASCHGMLGWFELDLAPGVLLSTSPQSIDTCWHQSYFPFEQLHLQAGDLLRTRVETTPDPETGTPVVDLRVEQRRGEALVAAREHRYTLHDTQG